MNKTESVNVRETETAKSNANEKCSTGVTKNDYQCTNSESNKDRTKKNATVTLSSGVKLFQ